MEMGLDRFLNLLAAVFGAMGSIYVLKGIAALSPDLIERQIRTYWSFNSAQIEALTAQKADAVVGIVLVIFALVIAIVNIALVPSDMHMFDRRAIGIAWVAGLSVAVYITLAFSGNAIQRHEKVAVGRIITAELLDKLFKTGKLPASEIGSLKLYGRTLLGMEIDDSESPRDILNRVAKAVGQEVPEDLDFSEIEGK